MSKKYTHNGRQIDLEIDNDYPGMSHDWVIIDPATDEMVAGPFKTKKQAVTERENLINPPPPAPVEEPAKTEEVKPA